METFNMAVVLKSQAGPLSPPAQLSLLLPYLQTPRAHQQGECPGWGLLVWHEKEHGCVRNILGSPSFGTGPIAVLSND